MPLQPTALSEHCISVSDQPWKCEHMFFVQPISLTSVIFPSFPLSNYPYTVLLCDYLLVCA